jgi:hypothetical protein
MIVTYAQRFVHILTSADLLTSPHDSNNFSSDMRIKVYLPNGQEEGMGFLRHYDLDYNVGFYPRQIFSWYATSISWSGVASNLANYWLRLG